MHVLPSSTVFSTTWSYQEDQPAAVGNEVEELHAGGAMSERGSDGVASRNRSATPVAMRLHLEQSATPVAMRLHLEQITMRRGRRGGGTRRGSSSGTTPPGARGGEPRGWPRRRGPPCDEAAPQASIAPPGGPPALVPLVVGGPGDHRRGQRAGRSGAAPVRSGFSSGYRPPARRAGVPLHGLQKLRSIRAQSPGCPAT